MTLYNESIWSLLLFSLSILYYFCYFNFCDVFFFFCVFLLSCLFLCRFLFFSFLFFCVFVSLFSFLTDFLQPCAIFLYFSMLFLYLLCLLGKETHYQIFASHLYIFCSSLLGWTYLTEKKKLAIVGRFS